jgi:hypothetical protein
MTDKTALASEPSVFFADPPGRLATGRSGSSKRNRWTQKLAAILAELADEEQTQPACIGQGMSYSNASSTASAIRKGKHGEGWLAGFALEDDVEPIERPADNADFKHYGVWVAYDALFSGDRELFG